MEPKQRLFIYDRKEIAVLILLGIMVAIFAFTFGVHLGKRIGPKALVTKETDATPVKTLPDKSPNRQELTEASKVATQNADDAINQASHDEVNKTGIKMDSPRQVDLPTRARSAKGGATTLSQEASEAEKFLNPGEDEEETSAGKTKKSSPSKHKGVEGSESKGEPANESPKESSKESPKESVDELAKEEASSPASTGNVPALKRPSPSGKYTLQVGSHQLLSEAQSQIEAIESAGAKPFARAAEIKGKGKWYRVYIGGFESKQDAEKAGERLKSKRVVDSFIISHMAP